MWVSACVCKGGCVCCAVCRFCPAYFAGLSLCRFASPPLCAWLCLNFDGGVRERSVCVCLYHICTCTRVRIVCGRHTNCLSFHTHTQPPLLPNTRDDRSGRAAAAAAASEKPHSYYSVVYCVARACCVHSQRGSSPRRKPRRTRVRCAYTRVCTPLYTHAHTHTHFGRLCAHASLSLSLCVCLSVSYVSCKQTEKRINNAHHANVNSQIEINESGVGGGVERRAMR